MLIYNPKDWIHFLFRIHKSDTLRKLFPLMVFVFVFSLAVAYWEIEYLHLSDTSWFRNVNDLPMEKLASNIDKHVKEIMDL